MYMRTIIRQIRFQAGQDGGLAVDGRSDASTGLKVKDSVSQLQRKIDQASVSAANAWQLVSENPPRKRRLSF
jgi:hypothetical protein